MIDIATFNMFQDGNLNLFELRCLPTDQVLKLHAAAFPFLQY